jgi:tetratricopeptide (TPR) repeat protein
VRRAILLALAAGLLALALPAPAEIARDEERLGRADALLAEKSGWDEAVAIYRALADEDPSWVAPRRQLARVLAWRGDYEESLALYDALLTASEPPADAAIERAEVLSWAGRSAEAQAAFEAVLAERPADPRAARGLARVHRWAGERSRADEWYRRALAAEEDPEARAEWIALRSELVRGPGARARFYRDSDDFTYLRSEARFELDLDFDTRLRMASGTTRASLDEWPAGARLAGEPEEDRGYDARLAVERRLARRWKGLLEVGGRAWEHGDARPLVKAALEWSPDERTAIAMELRHDDLLERSFSLASVLRGIGDTTFAASSWRQLSPRFEAWAGSEASLLTDGNAQGSLSGSLSFKPWPERQVLVGVSAGGGGYRNASPYYYSPELDTSATLSAQGRLPVLGPLVFAFDVGGGAGYAVEKGESGFGPAYRAKGGLAWSRGGLTASFDIAHSQSVRSTEYRSDEIQLSLAWTF